MKIYTKTGDLGETSLVGGKRTSKADLRLEAYGTVDELNSVLGLLISEVEKVENPNSDLGDITASLQTVQDELFNLGSQLACESDEMKLKLPNITDSQISRFENLMDQYTTELPPLKNFILPGGPAASAMAHFARTVCRRAERATVRLHHESPVDSLHVRYLNRLSDYLFVLARLLSLRLGAPEKIWNSKTTSSASPTAVKKSNRDS